MENANQYDARIAGLYRYPVKGLSPEVLASVRLTTGMPMPFDRAWAIENGAGRFDASAPKYLPKTSFVMLMRHEMLASLKTVFDETTSTLTIARDGETVASGCLLREDGRAAIEAFIMQFMGSLLRGPPRIVSAPQHSFSDVSAKCVHIVSRSSLDELQVAAGRDIDVLRFRPNIVVEGWPAWREFELVGHTIAVGEARLKVFKRTARCAATNVDPATGARDMEIPDRLRATWGHADFGIYAKVVRDGEIARGGGVASVT